MTQPAETGDKHDLPVRRLVTFYVASLCMIALLSSVSQAVIFNELFWQVETIRSVGNLARLRALERPLSQSALSFLKADESDPLEGREVRLRKAILRGRQDVTDPARPGEKPGTGMAGSMTLAETHRRAALAAADDLLRKVGRGESGATRPEDFGPLVRNVVAEEEAFGRTVDDATRATELNAFLRIERLVRGGLQLFGLVLVVMVLEGFFVIKPMLRKIETSVKSMERSHKDLRLYSAKLERSNKELQDFASVASHDLQEPLRKVQAFSDRLKSKCAGSIDDQGRDYLDRIQNAAKRMQTLINDLLSYARVATKAQPFVASDLATITRDVISDLEARIEDTAGRVEVGELPEVDADPLQARQLMQNLIGNALKYRRPGVPPVVRISGKVLDEDPSLTSSVRLGPVCRLLIEDNGIGFEEVYAERIFTIFQRLHGREEYEGTGVGLAICRKIVERHGGSITAEGKPLQGSTFIVTLPVRQPKEMASNG